MVIMRLIGFLDLINVGKMTKIKAIGVYRAEFLTKILVQGGHFEFSIFEQEPLVVPAIFEISIPKNPTNSC